MRTSVLVIAVIGSVGLLACKSGLKSQACVDYFAKTEACAAKASPIKAEALRKSAAVSKENFEKNANPMAVEQSCKLMLETLEKDPECK
jgi:hypothetical protein